MAIDHKKLKAPNAFIQAALLVMAGSFLGLLGDVVLPDGILAHRDTVLRDLELQVPVFLWPADEAMEGINDGQLLALDGRSEAEFTASHLAGSIHASLEQIEADLDTFASKVAGRTVVVIMTDRDLEEARELAQRIATDLGAKKVGTLKGGFEALLEHSPTLEGENQ